MSAPKEANEKENASVESMEISQRIKSMEISSSQHNSVTETDAVTKKGNVIEQEMIKTDEDNMDSNLADVMLPMHIHSKNTKIENGVKYEPCESSEVMSPTGVIGPMHIHSNNTRIEKGIKSEPFESMEAMRVSNVMLPMLIKSINTGIEKEIKPEPCGSMEVMSPTDVMIAVDVIKSESCKSNGNINETKKQTAQAELENHSYDSYSPNNSELPLIPIDSSIPNPLKSSTTRSSFPRTPSLLSLPSPSITSSSPKSPATPNSNSGSSTSPFPSKLRTLLATEDTDIVSWLPRGDAFKIRNTEVFEKDVLPKYFRHTKLTSFQRQLNLYGIRRVKSGPNQGAYRHDWFHRDHPDWCMKMKRTKQKPSASPKLKGTPRQRSRSVGSEPSEYALDPPAFNLSSNAKSTNTIMENDTIITKKTHTLAQFRRSSKSKTQSEATPQTGLSILMNGNQITNNKDKQNFNSQRNRRLLTPEQRADLLERERQAKQLADAGMYADSVSSQKSCLIPITDETDINENSLPSQVEFWHHYNFFESSSKSLDFVGEDIEMNYSQMFDEKHEMSEIYRIRSMN